MWQAMVLGAVVVSLAIGGCAKRNEVELQYDDPITNVWTGDQKRGQGTPAAAPPSMPPPPPPAPAAGPSVQNQSPPVAAPQRWPAPDPNTYPADADGTLPPEAFPEERPRAQGSTQPSPHLKAQPVIVTDPATGATTVVVPDQGPTTATTLKRRGGWVRGGYD